MTRKLTKRDIAKYQKTIGTAWSVSKDGTELSRTLTFPNFLEAFMFVTRVGVHAEVLGDYPVITIHEAKVKLVFSSPEAGGLTVSNFKFAEKVDVIFALSTAAQAKRITHY